MVYIESVFGSDCKNVTFRNNYKNSQTSVDDKKKQLNCLINMMFKIFQNRRGHEQKPGYCIGYKYISSYKYTITLIGS